jgi:ankyrin repeat protein
MSSFNILNEHLRAAIARHDIADATRILAGGADVNGANDMSNTRMLAHAVRARAPWALLELLLENGAELQPADLAEVDPLYVAASFGDLTVCRALVERGAKVNRQSEKGAAALHIAAGKAEVEVCAYLLSIGADAQLEYQLGLRPLHFAAKAPSSPRAVEVARLLLEHGANPSQLPESPSEGDTTPCQHAAFTGNVSVLAYFFRGCDQDPTQRTLDGRTLLDLASDDATRELIRAASTEYSVASSLGRRAARCSGEPNFGAASFRAL